MPLVWLRTVGSVMWIVLSEIVGVLNESAVYLLFGFALAGVLHVALRRAPVFTRLLAAKGPKSVFLAALLGAPLPLCSCGVVPTGLALRKRGASKGATVSFLISAPETDITSILLTYGLLGPIMAVFRPLAAVITAVAAGLATDFVDRWTHASGDSAGRDALDVPYAGSDDGGEREEQEYDLSKGPIWNALHYGFVRSFDDIIGSLLLGVVVGGVIAALLPRFGLDQLAHGSFLTMLVMLLIGIPMYVCATASTPIAAGLIAAGVSPGAALVFLLAGPATNIGSLLVLSRYLGRAILATYLASIAVVSVVMGLWLDASFGRAAFVAASPSPVGIETPYGAIRIGGAILLLVLACLSFRRTRLFDRITQRINDATGLRIVPRTGKVLAVAACLAAYFGSGFFIVAPGERAVETRFGRIVRSYLRPGLHYRWPYPIGAARIASTAKVQWIEIGFRRDVDDSSPSRQADRDVGDRAWESQMLTAHEDIIDVKWVVQYRVRDSRQDVERYLYGLSDPAELVRCAADSAIRVATGGRGIDTLLTTDRQEVERAVREALAAALDQCGAGVEVVRACLVSVHAPQEVHWAFRDVASAGEDKMRTTNQAHEYAERIVPEAEGNLVRQVQAAQGKSVEIVERAQGQAVGFAARLAAYRESAAIMRLRLYLERMDAVLPALKKYVCLSKAAGQDIDLWLLKGVNPGLPQAPWPQIGDGPAAAKDAAKEGRSAQ